MSERFFVAQLTTTGEITLSGPEAHHLIHVMRGHVGQQVVLFDGLGHEALAEIIAIQKKTAVLRIVEHGTVSRELPVAVTVASPLPKGDRERFFIEKLTELGVTAFIPLITHRSVVQPDENVVNRLRRIVIEASKQCGRNHLMDVTAPCKWEKLIAEPQEGVTRLFAHPFSVERDGPPQPLGSDRTSGLPASLEALLTSEKVLVAVGPEGGLTPEEVGQALAKRWIQVDLGPRILRVETAAIVLAVLIGTIRQVRAQTQGS